MPSESITLKNNFSTFFCKLYFGEIKLSTYSKPFEQQTHIKRILHITERFVKSRCILNFGSFQQSQIFVIHKVYLTFS